MDANSDPGEKLGTLKAMDYESQTNRRPREESDKKSCIPNLAGDIRAGRNMK